MQKNSYFSKYQKYTRKEYLDWTYEQLNTYSSGLRPIYLEEKSVRTNDGLMIKIPVERYLAGYSFSTHAHPDITKFRHEWYPNGIKQIPNNLKLNPLRIAIWYLDDGSNNFDQRNAIISTNCFTIKEVEFLCDKLKYFDLYPSINTIISVHTGKIQPILKFYGKSYENLINLVKPYMIWDCFQYKIEWRQAKHNCERNTILNEQKVMEIIELRKTKKTSEIAKKFNVSNKVICNIASGKTWQYIERDRIWQKGKEIQILNHNYVFDEDVEYINI